VGYDTRESLGNKETGAVAALPIWMNFMRAAIAGKPDEQFPGDQPTTPMERAALARKPRAASLSPVSARRVNIRVADRQAPPTARALPSQ
jgi:penicillin-binding protein 1A